ncbi:MAG: RecX family transcriptional regulator [Anaerolineae bacterium]|nr:RecX family transcriptional regulator [Anaerolineae bacterium]
MAGTITALQVQKKNPNRVNVYLDGRFAFGLPDIVAARLRHGQLLSEAEIAALQGEDAVERAYNRCLDYLAYRPRSVLEVRTYLKKREVAEAHAEAVIARLTRAGLLDDEAFARFWVENRERFRPRGPRALRYELREKGIDDRTIDQVLEPIDASDGAYRSGRKKAEQLRNVDHDIFYRKLGAYLARRGFDYETAREVTDALWNEFHAAG